MAPKCGLEIVAIMHVKWQRFVSIPLLLAYLILIPSCTTGKKPAVPQKPVDKIIPEIYEYSFPDSVTVCGETIDLTDAKNLELFDREFTITVWDRPQVFMWVKRTGRFFPYFEKRLEEEGLPDDLKYLAVAESSLHTHIKSKAGALGIWQLMEDTAKRYGLMVDKTTIDERLCFERSTDAVMQYLSYLKGKFDTWTLVMAAYNCGENKVNKALKNQGAGDYFKLNLPRETERYVFRIAAIKLVMENLEKYGYNVEPSRIYNPVKSTSVDVDIKERFYISDIADLTGIGYKEFMELNPKILSPLLPLGSYSLIIPPGYSDKLLSSMEKLDDPLYREKHNYRSKYYIVQPGDVLCKISWETGVPVGTLKKLNSIRGSIIRPGQKLLIRK